MKCKRNYIRFDVPLNLVFRPLGNMSQYQFGKTVNVSRKGFCFESENFECLPEKGLELKLEIPGMETHISCMGKVIWHKKLSDQNRAGVELKLMFRESQWEMLDYCYNQWLAKRRNGYSVNRC